MPAAQTPDSISSDSSDSLYELFNPVGFIVVYTLVLYSLALTDDNMTLYCLVPTYLHFYYTAINTVGENM